MESTFLLPPLFRRLRHVGVLAAALAWGQVNEGLAESAANVPADTPGSPHPVRVHYRVETEGGTGSCLSHARIQSATNRALKRAVFFPAPESDVVVALRPVGEFGADVSLRDVAGQSLGSRSLQAKNCAELSELLVFTLTVMVDFGSDEVGRKREEAAAAQRAAQTAAAPNGETTGGAAVSTPDPAEPRTPEAAKVAPPQAASKGGSRGPGEGHSSHELAIQPAAGAIAETGLTPIPLAGLYAQALFTGSAPLVFGVRLRGQHMFETPRAGGRLGAWRAAVTGQACWLKGAAGDLVLGVCLGVTPSLMWVSSAGFDADRTTAFGGVGVEPTFELGFPVQPGVAARISLGGGIPLLLNDWHAQASDGEQVNLFRAQAVGMVLMAGLSWGSQ